MSEDDSHDDLFDDAELDDVSIAPRNKRLFAVFGIALAGFVFIAVAATALILWLVFVTRDRIDPNHTVRQKYQARYATCVAGGGGVDGCSGKTLTACEADPWWVNPSHHAQRETVCLAVVPGKAH